MLRTEFENELKFFGFTIPLFQLPIQFRLLPVFN